MMNKECDTLIEGTLASLQPCAMQIAKPRTPLEKYMRTHMPGHLRRDRDRDHPDDSNGPAGAPRHVPESADFFETHDPMAFIAFHQVAPLHSQGPVPAPLYMPFSQASQPTAPKRYANGLFRLLLANGH